MIISIDSGNRNIKTDNFVFPSSLASSSVDLGYGSEVLEYNGTYYSLDGDRIKYMRDKTSDDRFFILALFGIAKEIELKIKEGKVKEGGTYSITLLNGLPPKHIAQAEKFKNYFMRDGSISFIYNKRKYTIKIKDVHIFPQAYAVAGTMKKKIATEDELLIVDIGGWTLDYMILNNGRYNMNKCESLEYGIIKLYNTIMNYCNTTYDINLKEKNIDGILNGTCTLKLDQEVKDYVFAQADSFVNEIVNTLREQVDNIKIIPVIFVGGGSITLRKFFENHPLLPNATFIDDVKANAIGYKALYRIANRQKARN